MINTINKILIHINNSKSILTIINYNIVKKLINYILLFNIIYIISNVINYILYLLNIYISFSILNTILCYIIVIVQLDNFILYNDYLEEKNKKDIIYVINDKTKINSLLLEIESKENLIKDCITEIINKDDALNNLQKELYKLQDEVDKKDIIINKFNIISKYLNTSFDNIKYGIRKINSCNNIIYKNIL